ncbi:MAG: shikimate dehydrogenase [Candidatus Omnitrophota bacterium]
MDIYGLIGFPVKHSLSPAMHNAAFRYLNIEAKYELFNVEPEKLEDFILNRSDVSGFNITVPHKVRAKDILCERFPPGKKEDTSLHIRLSGAVNTVKRRERILEYLNTDVYGFWKSLKEDLSVTLEGKTIFLIGSGGAGRAIITGLSIKGVPSKKIYVYENNIETAKSAKEHFSKFLFLKEKIGFIESSDIERCIKESDVLINATPVGMKDGDECVIDKKLLHPGLSVYDVVYNRETELLKESKELGIRAVGGKGMLLYQGARAFEFWTDKPAPLGVMREALDEALKNSNQ